MVQFSSVKVAHWESPLNLFGQIKNEKNDDGFGTEKTKIIKKIHENQTYFGRTKEHEKHI